MDKSSFAGLSLAVVGILAGLLLEGGNLGQILQPTAAMIVFGGTIGAVMLQFPMQTIVAAFQQLLSIFWSKQETGETMLKQILVYANKARRSGVVSLDQDLSVVTDPFLKQALMLAVDGTEPSELRKIMELELNNQSEKEERVPAGV